MGICKWLFFDTTGYRLQGSLIVLVFVFVVVIAVLVVVLVVVVVVPSSMT